MSVRLDTPIQYLKGVGPKLGDTLRKRGISTIGDLLHWYPKGYEDQRAARSIASLQPGQFVSLKAKIKGVRQMNMGRSHRKMYDVVLMDGTGVITCKYFRSPYRGYFDQFKDFDTVRVSGKVSDYRGRIQFSHPSIEIIDENEPEQNRLIPLYTETEGLRPAKVKQLVAKALELALNEEEYLKTQVPPKNADFKIANQPVYLDPLPEWMKKKYQLIGLAEALKGVHQPAIERADEFIEFRSSAHRRLIFDEFFQLELQLALKRSGMQKAAGPSMQPKENLVNACVGGLGFKLTQAQNRAFKEIKTDMLKPHPMHRMVQGDVGCGKTMVALMSASFAIENGYQVALMVPTEILAEQHFKSAKNLLQPLGVRVEFLSGAQKASEKSLVLEKIESGSCDLIVGTHALIQEKVFYKNLGLVIIDEQHRFGVEQRRKLKGKGCDPHFLVMTATPIPRTLAMTVYGDLDVTIIDELPKGRKPILTRVTSESKRDKVYGFMRDQIKNGRQAYVVFPLVEESEKIELKNATDEYEGLKAKYPDIRFGLLHGKMRVDEKDQIMNQFRQRELDVLVATTVIEVGVDVPNANMMIVEHSERFGLSQLHQLRGRVGRGEHKSYCVLVLGYAVSEESRERAMVMEQTGDGFKVAEADLELRGPGEFLGARQSGLPGFRLANIVRDAQILSLARNAAFELVNKDPQLTQIQHIALKVWRENHQGSLIG